MTNQLYAGAGKAEIRYTEEMLPTYGEGYNAIHDLPMLQVLLLRCGEGYAIISVDIVMLEIKEQMRKEAAKELGLPEEHILIHATHVLATPHFREWASLEEWQQDFMHSQNPVPEEEARAYMERDNRMVQAHLDALRAACRQAKNTLQPAAFGVGVANAPVNVNRVVETKDGWWQGVNPNGPSDHSVPVLRFDDTAGKPIAILYNCNVAPGCMEFSTVNGGRMVSGDLAGASQRFVDEAYGGESVSIYTTGYTGDQWQALRARLDYIDRDDNQIVTDFGEGGFQLVQVLATRLGEQVVHAAEAIATAPLTDPIALDCYRFTYPGQRVTASSESGPTRDCTYLPNGTQDAELKILQIGDTAILACGVELCSETFAAIQAGSPFAHTLLMEFTTEGGGYMPEEIFYDRMSFQSRKSRYAKGSAERFREDILQSLRASYDRHHTS